MRPAQTKKLALRLRFASSGNARSASLAFPSSNVMEIFRLVLGRRSPIESSRRTNAETLHQYCLSCSSTAACGSPKPWRVKTSSLIVGLHVDRFQLDNVTINLSEQIARGQHAGRCRTCNTLFRRFCAPLQRGIHLTLPAKPASDQAHCLPWNYRAPSKQAVVPQLETHSSGLEPL